MSLVTIKVTQEDINNGEKCHSRLCPVAQAAARAFPDYYVEVGVAYLYLYKKDDDVRYTPLFRLRLSSDVYHFITRFDRGLEVEPITFQVDCI